MRRWRYPENEKYSSLITFICKTFNFSDSSLFTIQFEDEENDKITISNEDDFNDAFQCAIDESRKSLKIFVNVASNDNSHSNVKEASEPKAKNEEPKKDCGYWRECGLNFLQNEEIQRLLPELVRRIIVKLRKESLKDFSKEEKKEMNGNEMEDSNDNNVKKDFGTIVKETLSEEKFKIIGNHELVSTKLDCFLPFVSMKIDSYLPMILEFNEDAIAAWVPHLIQIAIRALTNFQNITFDIEMDPFNFGQNGIFPQWFAFTDNQNQRNSSETVHNGVACDECEMYPIIGSRYKCGVCPNYDLCSKCESSKKHDANHPLIKFNVASSESDNLRYAGMREVFESHRMRGGHGGPFGGRHHWGHGPHGHGFHGHHGPRGPFGGRHHFGHPHGPFGGPHHPPHPHPHGSFGGPRRCPFMERRGCPFMNEKNNDNNNNDGGNGARCQRRKGGCSEKVNDNINLLNDCAKSFGDSLYKNKNKNNNNKNKHGKIFNKIEKAIRKEAKKAKREAKRELKEAKKGQNNDKNEEGILCMCGELLSKMIARKAYKAHVPVTCDVCNARVMPRDLVYHCPNNESLMHPHGYDVCANCVALQMSSFSSFTKEIKQENDKEDIVQSNIVENEENGASAPVIEDISDNKEDINGNNQNNDDESGDNMDIEMTVDDLYDSKDKNEIKKEANDESAMLNQLFGANDNMNNNDNDNSEIIIMDEENDNESEIIIDNNNNNNNNNSNDSGASPIIVNEDIAVLPPVPEVSDVPQVPIVPIVPGPEEDDGDIEEEIDSFLYKDSLDSIVSMGFEDNDGLRAILIKHKGNVDQAINQLLG